MAETEQKTVQIPFRVTEGRHMQLRQAALDRATSIQAMLEEGLDLLMATKPTNKEQRLVADLAEIVRSREVRKLFTVLGKLAGK